MSQKSRTEIRKAMSVLRDIYVVTPWDQELHDQLDRLMDYGEDGDAVTRPVEFSRTKDSHGIAVVAAPGAGKTSLVDHVLRHHPSLVHVPEGQRLVVAARVPSPATLKSLAFEILQQSGYGMAGGNDLQWRLWNLVRHRLKELGTVLLWIDEAQDMFGQGKKGEAQEILNTLKGLMQGDWPVVVVLSGTDELWAKACVDEQFARRMTKVELPLLSNAANGRSLSKQIATYCASIDLAPPDDRELVQRLIHASRARFGLCIENCLQAIEIALEEGATQLDRDHFAIAWGAQRGCDRANNVFVADRWSEIDVSRPCEPMSSYIQN
ncbi:MAG: transposase [Alphaproteobacteria bacterium]|nr:transposase [Alphaproteobacteria bacterium]